MEAPTQIPPEMLDAFSMQGKAIIEYRYANDCSDETQELINNNFTEENFNTSLARVHRNEQNYYGLTDTWMYEAIKRYPLEDKSVCIMGSTYPWYEAMVVDAGAASCTVIEYSPRPSFHDKITYLQPHEVVDQQYDVCLSISSYEHDGLGRYGDPLNPTGDLEAMTKTKNNLTDDGLLFLCVPMGLDKVVFNLHRVYGRARIPLLLQGWSVVDRFGFFKDTFTNNTNGTKGSPYQPIYILKK